MYWFEAAAPAPNAETLVAAEAHQANLTKPTGSLGQLETIAEQFCAFQNTLKPSLARVAVRVFAGDHGVCAQSVSAFPQEVTVQMIANFCSGGAAVSVLSQAIDADFRVINMGVATPLLSTEGVVNIQLMAGTHDFSQRAAMPEATALAALEAGAQQVPANAELCIGGEMGIGNTSSASALYCALLGMSAADAVGPGTGLAAAGLAHKRQIIEQVLALHQAQLGSPLATLSTVGGLEIAGLAGFYIAAAQAGIPVLVDGFISTAAALVASRLNPTITPWLLFAHQSAEPAHQAALAAMAATPILQLGMRLGEGSGAVLAVNIIRQALLLHNNMASFEQAGVASAH